MTNDEAIKELIKNEAPSDSPHDEAYRKELLRAGEAFKDMGAEEIGSHLDQARIRYRGSGGTHAATADCMVLNALLGKDTRIDMGLCGHTGEGGEK